MRGLLFKEQEAGYLVGYLAALRAKNVPNGNGVIAAVGGLKIPPVDRFIGGYYQGSKAAWAGVKPEHSYSQDFVDQAKCKEQALNHIANGASVVFAVAGQCGLGVLSAAKERNVLRHRRRRRPVLPRQPRADERRQEGRRRRLEHDLERRSRRAKFRTNFNAIFTVKNGGVGYGKISTRAQPSWRKAVESVRKQIAAGTIKVTQQAPPATG